MIYIDDLYNMKMHISAKTDVGLVRENNEDSFIFCPVLHKQNWEESSDKFVFNDNFGSLVAVADGMGGANAGETASKIALETVKECFKLDTLTSLALSKEDICHYLEFVIEKANAAIMKRIELDPNTVGMGTTIVIVWLINNKAYIAWCGDSRCYVFNPRNGLLCLTKDHSYIQELIDKGELSIEDSFNHPDSSIITRCLGDSDTFVSPEILVYDVKANDTFLLCSDGLCGYCKDTSIERIMYENISNMEACGKSLIDLSLKAGGFDNVTVSLLSVVDDTKDKIEVTLWSKLKRLMVS